jgi:hypothetical protein
MHALRSVLLIVLLGAALPLAAQEGETPRVLPPEASPFGDPAEGFTLIRESPLSIDMEREEELAEVAREETKKRQEKRKRNVFYGIKTRKGFMRRGVGDNVELETFHYLPAYQPPVPFVPEVFWYDTKRNNIRSSVDFKPGDGYLLHGPYRRFLGEQILEEGIYYLGAKHGRWTSYDRNDILMSKEKFHKGWPKESMVRYYDQERKKLREVVPVVNNTKEGFYYQFHENGEVAVRGEYREDVRVGTWTEFYDFNRRRKKEIQYRSDPYDKAFVPYISREWNRRGQLVYERKF